MARCDVCGNDYQNTMEIRRKGVTGTYDCFECALRAMAPPCQHCGCRVIGHGVDAAGKIFCSAHCAQTAGAHPIHA